MNVFTQRLKPQVLAIGLAVLLVLVVGIVVLAGPGEKEQGEQEVVTVSTLERIINVSELSTFTAVYNGIAEIPNEKKPEKVDYYTSYEARVEAGIRFEDVTIQMDSETKTITITLPPVEITEVTVDIASLDFIFVEEKANTSTVTEEAYKACEADARRESESQQAIFELAEQNAENILTALVRPILEQMDGEYTLTVG